VKSGKSSTRPAGRVATLLVAVMLVSAAGCGRVDPAPVQDDSPGAAWSPVPLQGELPTDRPLQAAFLVLDGVFNTELTAPFDILHHTVFHTGDLPGIEVFTVSPQGAEVTTFEGLRIQPDYSFESAPAIDILVVPSAEGSMDKYLEDRELIDWVRRVGENALYIVSLCDGAFVLAEAGLLDHYACTTFPGDQDRFAEAFPVVDLRREPSFVHDGKAMTSQGGAKSFDVAMYLVEHLYGEQVATNVGRGLIISWPPQPGTMLGTVVIPGDMTHT
jgi:transcriptional regulator GlxA family with amidase domain